MTVETIEHTEAPTSDISWLKERPEYMPRGNSIVREDGVYSQAAKTLDNQGLEDPEKLIE